MYWSRMTNDNSPNMGNVPKGMTMKLMHTRLHTMSLTALMSATVLMLSQAVYAAPVENFGQNLTGLQQAFAHRKVHILQLGDSHTAGDYFTEQLRKRLQADVDDGGIGFAYPMDVNGQRAARHGYQSNGWQLTNSRFNQSADYPLGGMLASPNASSDSLSLTSQYYNGDRQNARIVVKGQAGQSLTVRDASGVRNLPLTQNGWQTVNTALTFPSTFQASSNMSLGGFWLNRATGGVVSAMGINGATQDYWQRWHPQLAQDLAASQADLVILAYGTNEAFQNNVSGQVSALQQAIRQIRQGLPNASILLVNAPESLKSTAGSCGTRATSLDDVQAQIRQVAANSGALYWSWQDAMGGRCSMKNWIVQGLGRSDGVHFSRKGYELAANDLYDGLKTLLASTGNGFATNSNLEENRRRQIYRETNSNNNTYDATHTSIRRIYSTETGSGQIRGSQTGTLTNVPSTQPRRLIEMCVGENCALK